MSRIFNKTGIYLAANLISMGIPFALLPVLTRVLTPEDYGRIAMFGVALSFLSAFIGLSVHGVISVRYFQIEKTEFSKYVLACVLVLMASAAIASTVMLFFGGYLSLYLEVGVWWLQLAIVTTAFAFIANIILALWQANGSAVLFGSFQVTQSGLNLLLTFVFIFALGMKWDGRVLAQAISAIFFGLVALIILFINGYLTGTRLSRAVLVDTLRFGLPLMPHVLGGVALSMGDRFVVQSVLDTNSVGIYTSAAQIGLGLSVIYDAYFKSWHPEMLKMLSMKKDMSSMSLVSSVYRTIIICFCIMIIYVIVIWAIYPLLLGEAFAVGRPLMVILAMSSFLSACYYATSIFVFYHNRNELLSINTFLSGGLGVLSSYYLCLHFGLVGVGVGVVLGRFTSFLFTWFCSNMVHPLPWFYFLPRKT